MKIKKQLLAKTLHIIVFLFKHLLNHYTFLSRPVFIIDNKIYIGNTQQNMLQVNKALS